MNQSADNLLEVFNRLDTTAPSKELLAALFLRGGQDPELAAELLLNHLKPRTKNHNGCTCRFEDGEGCSRCSSWHSLFHGDQATLNAPPITFAIDGFLQNDAITMLGGLPGHGKTWVMLSMVKALLEGQPLFGYEPFKVNDQSHVVYLCPESSLTPFAQRLRLFDLVKHVRRPGGGRLFYQTISSPERIDLTDLRLAHAVNGAHVFLDTAVRFMDGDENSSGDQRPFADKLFNLLRAGAKSITVAHHSPKSADNIPADRMTLENVLRGTGDLGAMVATAWALKQIDGETNRIFVKNVKARDFDVCRPFTIEGRPAIDQTGDFKMTAVPGMAVAPSVESLNRQADARKERQDEAASLLADGKTVEETAYLLGVNEKTVRRWTKNRTCPDKCPAE